MRNPCSAAWKGSSRHEIGQFEYLYYCACGSKGRGIGLITSKPLTNKEKTDK
jgi:hypothetical protein